MTLLVILMLSPNFNFYVLPFASNEDINPHLPKFANKTNGTTLSRKVPITFLKNNAVGHNSTLPFFQAAARFKVAQDLNLSLDSHNNPYS